MLRLEADKMQKAIERARAEHLKVRIINLDNRTYAVTGKSGKTYTVKFVVVNGMKLAECSCPSVTYCKHMAAAAAVNMGIQGMRRQVRRDEFIRRNTGWMV